MSSEAPLEELGSPSLVELALDRIRRDILRGVFAPGSGWSRSS